MTKNYEVIVIGGGHNGLVTAGLLAKRGLRVCVLERSAQVGGACITETPWGPDYKVTALAYVMSIMPPRVVRELELEKHGYQIYPQHGYFAPHRDGRYLQLPDDHGRRYDEIAKFSARDAEAYAGWEQWLSGLGKTLGPLLSQTPPRLGSKRPKDLWEQLGLAWRMRGLDPVGLGDLTRLMTMSVADLLDERFESPALKGVLAVSGIIGAWAGPRAAGTAFLMAHHTIGEVGGSPIESWGFPRGGMGAVTAAMADAARSFGCEIRTEATVERICVEAGKAGGVILSSGEELRAPIVVSTTHPKITFLQHLDPADLPDEFVAAITRWKSRSGTVKINLAIDCLPDFSCKPGFDPEVHGGTIVLADSMDELEASYQEAAFGKASTRPFADICIPSVFDDSLAPEGKHVMSMFTQWVPHQWAQEPDADALDLYADRVIKRVDELAPGFRSSILHKQVIGPHEMQRDYGLVGGNIFHGELSASQIFHMRPAPGYADYRTPIDGLYNASSATHGGGGVTAIPALQVATAIAKRI